MAQKPAFQTILFPVDFSKMSEMTAPHVRGLAQFSGATVTLLHVVPWLSAWYGAGSTEIHPAIAGDQVLRGLEAEQAVRLERFREQYFKDVASRTSVKSGAVAESIADAANDAGADLIMMPTRDSGPSRRFLIGSTTAKVLHDAPCAVWTSSHLHELRPFSGFHHLLCTIDRNEVLPDFPEGGRTPSLVFRKQVELCHGDPEYGRRPGPRKEIRRLDKEYPEAGLHDELGLDARLYGYPRDRDRSVRRSGVLVDGAKCRSGCYKPRPFATPVWKAANACVRNRARITVSCFECLCFS